ncbi:MAG: hypothetical protein GOV00_03875 [Candidatus Altiarchaeota archaeon]|nr:hypothetical protein [Candidatus Altiarchaeota archaeon]
MGTKKYIIGGIDFIINKQNEPVFIEANSAPGAKLLAGTNMLEPIEALAKVVKKRVKNPQAAIVIRKKEKDEGNEWKQQQLNRFFPTHQCYFEYQDYSTPELVDENGKNMLPNVLLFNLLSFAQIYQSSAFMVNPKEAIRITTDKHLSTMIVQNLTEVRTPKNFMVFSGTGTKRVADQVLEQFETGMVLKPVFGWGGKGVTVWKKVPRDFPKFREPMVLQNRVDLELKDGKFWDVRCYVVNGKFCGAVTRTSKQPVVNMNRGGHFEKLNSEFVNLVKKPTEQVAAAIDKIACAISSKHQ